jgi:F-type H+-transporting ATPase subunit b
MYTQFASTEPAEASGVAALGINAEAFIIQLITFLFVFYVLRRWVFKPVVGYLNDREETIKRGVALTSQLTQQKDELDQEVARTQKVARKEADQIIADAHSQAKAIVKEAEETANSKADAILADADKKIVEERARMRRSLEKEVVSLVIDATEKVAGQKLDAKKDGALIDAALKGQA